VKSCVLPRSFPSLVGNFLCPLLLAVLPAITGGEENLRIIRGVVWFPPMFDADNAFSQSRTTNPSMKK
jgi:hypothetical protein